MRRKLSPEVEDSLHVPRSPGWPRYAVGVACCARRSVVAPLAPLSAAGCCREQDPQAGRVREALAACAATKACRTGKIEAPDPMGPRSGPSVVRVGDRAGRSAAVHSGQLSL